MTNSSIDPTEPKNNRFLIAGLGNPGRQYRQNRHNVGFMLLDKIAAHVGRNFSRIEHKALVIKTEYRQSRLILAKPQTFMNLSGQAINSLLRFYKIPLKHLLVAYDDIDLPLGTLRIRPHGGSGGHKGVQSIIDHLGNQNFARLRIGVGRPPGQKAAASYVLRNFSTQEADLLAIVLERGAEAAFTYITEGLEAAMNKYNGAC